MSAGSGLNALLRDEDNARQFLQRHQDKLIYGSDCNDRKAGSAKCTGLKQIETIKRLSATPAIAAKIFNKNARKIMKV
jgi:predicted TIM-barrel fold metal-dependent hydrolase